MSNAFIGLLGIIALLIILATSLPIALCLAVVGIAGLFILAGPEAAIRTIASATFTRMTDLSLIIIPLFVLMGMLAQQGGLSSRTYETLSMWVGKIKGGLAVATMAACTAFGTVCGSSMVTASVFAKISAPEMRRNGYDKKLAYATCSSGGTIGMLIPPSVLLVIYGIASQESIGRLLIGGISPGLVLFIIFALGILLMIKVRPQLATESSTTATWRQRISSLKSLLPVFISVAIIFGGIFTGIFSPAEAASVVVIILFAIMLTSKNRSWQSVRVALIETIATSSMIFLILVGAGIFTRFLVYSTLTSTVLEMVVSLGISPIYYMLATVLLYLVLGCFLDSISMVTITIPILHPAALALGIDPMQFAVVAVLAMEAGLLTPPIGLNIYAVKAVAEGDVTLQDLFAGIWPFLVMMLLAILLFVAIPSLSTFLPNAMYG
jgi:tripartite ATP-independent transporter DctM subunit